jgi:hypothetical protein
MRRRLFTGSSFRDQSIYPTASPQKKPLHTSMTSVSPTIDQQPNFVVVLIDHLQPLNLQSFSDTTC